MLKKFTILVSLLALLPLFGCSGTSGQSQALADLEVLRKATLASRWEMNQMKLAVEAAGELPILVKVPEGEKVDGYFYIESGDSITFNISGNSMIYQSVADSSGKVTSDRFSFTSTRDQGNTYSLVFKNPASGSRQKVTLFLEIIFPSSGSVFIPVAIK